MTVKDVWLKVLIPLAVVAIVVLVIVNGLNAEKDRIRKIDTDVWHECMNDYRDQPSWQYDICGEKP